MKIISKFAIATAFVALATCGSNNANNTEEYNTTDMNAGMTDLNTTDMNATTTDMNATGNVDMNATGANSSTNATGNAAANNAM